MEAGREALHAASDGWAIVATVSLAIPATFADRTVSQFRMAARLIM